jgi:hypothetical protein
MIKCARESNFINSGKRRLKLTSTTVLYLATFGVFGALPLIAGMVWALIVSLKGKKE